MNYFRITAYNRDEDYSIIIDSYGAFESLGAFSTLLVSKGFSIIAIGNQNFFSDGNIQKVTEHNNKIMLRAVAEGRPIRNGKQITIGDKTYTIA